MGIEFAHQTYNIDLIDFNLIDFTLNKSTHTKAVYVLFPFKNVSFFYILMLTRFFFASLKSKWWL